MYLGALQAAERMARAVDDSAREDRYARLARQGRQWIDEHLFNGEYYEQQIDPDAWKHAEHDVSPPRAEVPGMAPGEPKYQYGSGCLSDQLLAQTNAHVAGLGYLLDPANVRAALDSIMRYNFKADLHDHTCCQRVYALQDEAALLGCTWPRGGRPALPFPYCDESGWTGIEYHVAAHMFYEGKVQQGVKIVEAACHRYDGRRRNPYNEYECGSYYARSMASHGMLLALSGFQYDATEGLLGFSPRVDDGDFHTFWSAQRAWGGYSHGSNNAGTRETRLLHVLYGTLTLQRFAVDICEQSAAVKLNEQPVRNCRTEDGAVVFGSPLELKAGDELEIVVDL
jgi:hypothetical protein